MFAYQAVMMIYLALVGHDVTGIGAVLPLFPTISEFAHLAAPSALYLPVPCPAFMSPAPFSDKCEAIYILPPVKKSPVFSFSAPVQPFCDRFESVYAFPPVDKSSSPPVQPICNLFEIVYSVPPVEKSSSHPASPVQPSCDLFEIVYSVPPVDDTPVFATSARLIVWPVCDPFEVVYEDAQPEADNIKSDDTERGPNGPVAAQPGSHGLVAAHPPGSPAFAHGIGALDAYPTMYPHRRYDEEYDILGGVIFILQFVISVYIIWIGSGWIAAKEILCVVVSEWIAAECFEFLCLIVFEWMLAELSEILFVMIIEWIAAECFEMLCFTLSVRWFGFTLSVRWFGEGSVSAGTQTEASALGFSEILSVTTVSERWVGEGPVSAGTQMDALAVVEMVSRGCQAILLPEMVTRGCQAIILPYYSDDSDSDGTFATYEQGFNLSGLEKAMAQLEKPVVIADVSPPRRFLGGETYVTVRQRDHEARIDRDFGTMNSALTELEEVNTRIPGVKEEEQYYNIWHAPTALAQAEAHAEEYDRLLAGSVVESVERRRRATRSFGPAEAAAALERGKLGWPLQLATLAVPVPVIRVELVEDPVQQQVRALPGVARTLRHRASCINIRGNDGPSRPSTPPPRCHSSLSGSFDKEADARKVRDPRFMKDTSASLSRAGKLQVEQEVASPRTKLSSLSPAKGSDLSPGSPSPRWRI
ncbi:hypothetical protein DFH27DRAFT_645103 [Peziza echinospora]|nr:hypothetical protein DFH27DRAFT_645103 [Peziza echinospora]